MKPGMFVSWSDAALVLGGSVFLTYAIAAVCYALGELVIWLLP